MNKREFLSNGAGYIHSRISRKILKEVVTLISRNITYCYSYYYYYFWICLRKFSQKEKVMSHGKTANHSVMFHFCQAEIPG